MKFVFTDGLVIDSCASAELIGGPAGPGGPAVYTALQTEPGWSCTDPLLQGVTFSQQQQLYQPLYTVPQAFHYFAPPPHTLQYFHAAPPVFPGGVELRPPFPAALNEQKPTEEPSALAASTINQRFAGEHHTEQQQSYVKKPLNAYMLYLKEQRSNVKAEIKSKGGSAVNAFLGAQWKTLTKQQKAKYFREAEQQSLLHKRLNPGWSTKDNYGKKLTKAQKRRLEGE